MDEQERRMPAWLPGLVDQVEQGLERMSSGRHDQRPAWEQESKEIEEQIQGWSASLAKPQLPAAVREAIEVQWGAAVKRRQEVENKLSELTQESLRAEHLVRPEQVLDRLDQLAGVLAANDPTRGNLELSLHIDRITCYQDRRVTLKTCKLGVLPDAVELFSPPVVKPTGTALAEFKSSRARRRGKLRVVEDDGAVDLRAQANFIADPDRFVGLGDEWFWIDEFPIPGPSPSWAEANADAVFQRRQETKFPFSRLAEEFGVTPPTIGAAIQHYLKAHPDEQDIRLLRGGKRRPKVDLSQFAAEARQLWIAGWSMEKLAEKYKYSAPTVEKAIAFAYAQEGLPMPTREEVRRSKAAEARRMLDEGKSLEKIARDMKISDVTARQYLKASFAAEGKTMPDLRFRRQVG